VLVPLAGGKVLSWNWSRTPAFMRFVFTGFFELSLMFALELQTWCFVPRPTASLPDQNAIKALFVVFSLFQCSR
jgi:hypothetical protein